MQKIPAAPPWLASGQPEQTPSTLQRPLPVPPPSVTKKTSIWDKDHISGTLLDIGQAFLSNQNFGEGLGAAAGAMSRGQKAIQDQSRKSISYGGPNGQFEIATDAQGNRTVRQVPEFAAAAQADRDAKVKADREAREAPNWKDMRSAQTAVVHQIGQLDTSEQRAATYADLLAHPERYGGVDTRGLPPIWSDTYGAVMGGSGQTVVQDRKGDRDDEAFDWRKTHGDRIADQGDQRLTLQRQKAAKAGLPKAPPSTRKPAAAKLPNGFILN